MTRRSRPLILLLGGSGQVGWELQRALAPIADLVAPGRAALDLRDEPRLRDLLPTLRPDAVVNAAADTDVDGAESRRERAFGVNADAPRILAEECARLDALLVHYSTDYVFDGRASAPYVEDAPTAPLNIYGESKLAGEEAISAAGGPHLILRTSWVYGLRGRNFLTTIMRLARERPVLDVVHDQVGCPTWSRMLAAVTAALIARCTRAGTFMLPPNGIYHVCGEGSGSWWDFANAILALDPCPGEHVCGQVRAIASEAMPRPAARPAFSVLDARRFQTTFGLRLPDWREQLALAMADLGEQWRTKPPSRTT